MIINANRSETYVGTVNLNDPEDQAWIQTIRTFVSEASAQFPKQRYVKLQGRGPRAHNGRRYHQGLPLKYAKMADVYVYPRDPYAT